MSKKIALSFSGKDSVLALHRLLNNSEYDVTTLITTANKKNGRTSMHGVRVELLRAQAASIGLPLKIIWLPENCSNEKYSETMAKACGALKKKGIEAIAYGDIMLEDVRKYREEAMAKAGMQAIFPLWGQNTANVMNEFLGLGYKTIITCVDTDNLDAAFSGKVIDEKLLAQMPPHVDICGENGEYHSFVFDGPIFNTPISFTTGEQHVTNDSSTNKPRFCFTDIIPTNIQNGIQTKGERKMKIVDVICSPGLSGFFFDDQKAIKTMAVADGNMYKGEPMTEGFRNIRLPGESISVLLVLEDGQVAHGDCTAVQYSGASGRDPLFLAKDFIPVIERAVKPVLVGHEVTSFRELAAELDSIVDDGKILHTAIRYGITQAALDAVAKAQNKLMAQVVAEEYGTTVSDKMIPVFTQSGDDRFLSADKMILKSADVLPHALFNNIEKAGKKGEKLLEYVLWLRNRIYQVRVDEDYRPIIHIDVYGMLGEIFGEDYYNLVSYLRKLEEAAMPFKVRIEGPVDAGSLSGQIAALKRIREICAEKGVDVEIVADEWCNTLQDVKDFTDNKAGHQAQIKTPDLGGINNTIEAILYCKANGMGAYLGGSCNETDRSAQICAHIAMAIQPVQMLAKPGMGADEAYMIVNNEMRRILALKDIMGK